MSSVLVALAPVEGLMTMTDARPLGADEATFIAAARSGDTARFALITERHRRELQVHCYRMLANYEDAQDVTQETFLRAWNKRESFKGHAALRTWLYRIATNACLDFLEKRNDRTPVPSGLSDPGSEVLYLQPYPDRMLPGPAGIGGGAGDDRADVHRRRPAPAAAAAGGVHPARRPRLASVEGRRRPRVDRRIGDQRTAAGARDDARATARPPLDWRSPATHELSDDERGVVKSYIDAHERNDLDGLMSLLRDDLRFAMLPDPGTLIMGAKDAVDGWVSGGLFQPGYDDWRCITTTVNRMPAAALYLRTPDDPEYRLLNIAVLHIADGKIAELTGFDATDKPWLGLPPTL
jgi:RNA polymerase sigma-70 factor (ECF subfamily)